MACACPLFVSSFVQLNSLVACDCVEASRYVVRRALLATKASKEGENAAYAGRV